MKEKTRILIVHGYCMLRSGLVDRLTEEPWIDVCGVASQMSDVHEMIFEHRPNVLLANISPKCSSGVGSLKKLKREFGGMKILAFSCGQELEDIYAGIAVNTGADGYISSTDTPEEMISAIKLVRMGGRYVSPQVGQSRSRRRESVPGLASLTRREAEVFFLTGCGYMTRSIADMMDLKVKTIETYRDRIRKKLDLPQGADLLYAAVSFMRNVSRGSVGKRSDRKMIRELLAATA